MENFDAVGRYREQERAREIDASGHYVDRQGNRIEFSGVEDLANYLADSDDSRQAFVARAFQHFVKQPPAAYGADTLDRLTKTFEESDCNIRQLLVEIAVVAATEVLTPADNTIAAAD